MTSWRTMTDSDLPAVKALADAAHPDLPERLEILRDKRVNFPPGCHVLADEARIAGYGIAHPWVLGTVPPLDAPLRGLPSRPTCFYLHDVAIAPEARRRGAAADYLSRMVELSQLIQLDVLALVAVHGTEPVWQRLGFVASPETVAIPAEYGAGARYMVRRLTS